MATSRPGPSTEAPAKVGPSTEAPAKVGLSWLYRLVLGACMSLIAWGIDRKLQHGRDKT